MTARTQPNHEHVHRLLRRCYTRTTTMRTRACSVMAKPVRNDVEVVDEQRVRQHLPDRVLEHGAHIDGHRLDLLTPDEQPAGR